MLELSERSLRLDPSIICITESWLSSLISDNYVHLEDYTVFRNDRNENGGGIIIYAKSALNYKIFCSTVVAKSDILILYSEEKDIYFFAIYHPHWGQTKAHQEVIDFLHLKLSHLKETSKVIICGDFNDLRLHID